MAEDVIDHWRGFMGVRATFTETVSSGHAMDGARWPERSGLAAGPGAPPCHVVVSHQPGFKLRLNGRADSDEGLGGIGPLTLWATDHPLVVATLQNLRMVNHSLHRRLLPLSPSRPREDTTPSAGAGRAGWPVSDSSVGAADAHRWALPASVCVPIEVANHDRQRRGPSHTSGDIAWGSVPGPPEGDRKVNRNGCVRSSPRPEAGTAAATPTAGEAVVTPAGTLGDRPNG